MTEKEAAPVAAYSGLIYVDPNYAGAMISSNSGKNQSFETHQMSSKAEYKHYGGSCSTKVTKTQKSGVFVDGRNGNPGYKEEVGYKSSVKVNDKNLGCTTHYETQVKHKKVTTYSNPNKGGSGGVGNGTNHTGKGSGGVKFKTVTTYSSPAKSSGGSGSRSYGGSKKTNYFPY